MERHGRRVCARLYLSFCAVADSFISLTEQLNHAGSKYKTLFVGSEAFEGHSDNLRDSPLPPYPLAVCQGQGDPVAKESQEAQETVWNDQEQGPGSAGGVTEKS
jgi:hypothetical protein